MKKQFLSLALLFLLGNLSFGQVYKSDNPFAHTFSIVARDSVTGEMGVAVQSHWFSVGTVVSWAEAGVGAIATQSFVNKSFGIRGLDFLRRGFTAEQTLDSLLKYDAGREVRQVAIVDTKGNVATHTGTGCIQYATQIQGNQFSVQSNMMLGNQVSIAMASAYRKADGKSLAEKLLMALEAAQGVGGDIRGQQSAAILIVPAKTEGKPWDERTVDLRVDDSKEPIKELRRLYNVHLAYEHMNKGDFAVEKNNMIDAMNEYNTAMKMMPDNLEMQYWTAVTLANNKEVSKAMPIFKKVFAKDKNWKELTRRLPDAKLLTVKKADLKKILAL
ncbi:MAG: DUF1028 domain-containing protein [Bacteroidota bacterium]